jgi:hypothetical protein
MLLQFRAVKPIFSAVTLGQFMGLAYDMLALVRLTKMAGILSIVV